MGDGDGSGVQEKAGAGETMTLAAREVEADGGGVGGGQVVGLDVVEEAQQEAGQGESQGHAATGRADKEAQGDVPLVAVVLEFPGEAVHEGVVNAAQKDEITVRCWHGAGFR